MFTFFIGANGLRAGGIAVLPDDGEVAVKKALTDPFGWGLYQIAWSPKQFSRDLKKWIQRLESKPRYVMFYRDLHRPFPLEFVKTIEAEGALPVISMEWWVWGKPHKSKKKEGWLPAINKGVFDAYFTKWAKAAKRHGQPILLRPGFEMDGDWFSWGNKPRAFRQAWKRVRNLFRHVGADNVKFIFSPNNKSIPEVEKAPWNDWYHYLPDRLDFDLLGLSGYNWGRSHGGNLHTWAAIESVFSRRLREIRTRLPKVPILICEFATAPDDGGSKVAWIKSAFPWLRQQTGVVGAIWFNYDKGGEGEKGWSLNSPPSSVDAFKQSLGLGGLR